MSVCEGKILIDVSRKYASIYRCSPDGKVVDEDHFAYPFRLDRQDAVSEVIDLYAMLYDWLNETINGGYEAGDGDSAREGEPPATTE